MILTSVENSTISIKDICIAATLVTLGAECVGVDVEWKGKKSVPTGFFVFDATPAVRDVIAACDRRDPGLKVSPWSFIEEYKGLKKRVERAAQ